MTASLVPFAGRAWRGHDPRWAHDPLSGKGAAITGGRFNRPGTPALYLALSPETAIREVQHGFANRFQPMTLAAYEINATALADLRDAALIREVGFSVNAPSCPWRMDVADGREPESWRLADALHQMGSQGVLVPSFAFGAAPHELNIVLWSWNDESGAEVSVIDDHGRLPQAPKGAGR